MTLNATQTRVPEQASALVKKIDKTTYVVRIYFSDTCTETISNKMKRMLKNEVSTSEM